MAFSDDNSFIRDAKLLEESLKDTAAKTDSPRTTGAASPPVFSTGSGALDALLDGDFGQCPGLPAGRIVQVEAPRHELHYLASAFVRSAKAPVRLITRHDYEKLPDRVQVEKVPGPWDREAFRKVLARVWETIEDPEFSGFLVLDDVSMHERPSSRVWAEVLPSIQRHLSHLGRTCFVGFARTPTTGGKAWRYCSSIRLRFQELHRGGIWKRYHVTAVKNMMSPSQGQSELVGVFNGPLYRGFDDHVVADIRRAHDIRNLSFNEMKALLEKTG